MYIKHSFRLIVYSIPDLNAKSKLRGHGPTHWRKDNRRLYWHAWSFWDYRWPVAWQYDWSCFFNLLDDMWAAINTSGLRNWVGCFEELHTMHGTCHIAGFQCIHKQSGCKWPHQVLGIPWVQSAIWREWKYRYWDKSRLRKEVNVRINTVWGMRPGLA
jgi:hypothetical protein